MNLPEIMSNWREQGDQGHRLVVFGSSNTELWWHNLGRFSWSCWLEVSLRAHVGKHVSLTNVGVCGETVKDLRKRYARDVQPLRPAMVIVTIGGNDRNFMSVAEYRASLLELGRRIQADGAIPVFQSYYSLLTEDMNIGPESFTPYMRAKRSVADEMGVPCIDSYPTLHKLHLQEPAFYRSLMLDPCHLNPLGHGIWGNLCARAFGLPEPEMPADTMKAWTQAKQYLAI